MAHSVLGTMASGVEAGNLRGPHEGVNPVLAAQALARARIPMPVEPIEAPPRPPGAAARPPA